MATILTVRNELASLLSSYLGTYTLANGATTPAISVRDQGGSLAAGTTVAGIECVVMAEPLLEPVRQYRQEHAIEIWTIYLVDWSGANAARLREVAARIAWKFPGSQTFAITVPKGVGPRNQIRVDVRTNPDRITS